MIRQAPALLAASLFLAAAPARACMPPAVEFARGSVRIDAANSVEIPRVIYAFRLAPRGTRVRLDAYVEGDGSRLPRRLARRRGDAVRAELIRRGIPARAIDLQVQFIPGRRDLDRMVGISLAETSAGCI